VNKALGVTNVLDWHNDSVVDLSGHNPQVRFTLEDGTVIDVIHQGDHLTIRNLGEARLGGMRIDPVAGNTVRVRGAR